MCQDKYKITDEMDITTLKDYMQVWSIIFHLGRMAILFNESLKPEACFNACMRHELSCYFFRHTSSLAHAGS